MMITKKAGFSLIEILIAVILIGSIVAMVGPKLMQRFGKGQIGTTKISLHGIKSTLDEYFIDMGHYPTKQEGGLDALVTKPNTKGADRYKGPYLDRVPTDAWNNEFIYNNPPQRFKEYKYYELYSVGNDEKSENNPDLRVGS